MSEQTFSLLFFLFLLAYNAMQYSKALFSKKQYEKRKREEEARKGLESRVLGSSVSIVHPLHDRFF